MKRAKRFFSALLTIVMVLSMSVTAFAADDGSITIKGSTTVPVSGKTFNAYKILDAELANGENASGGIVYRVPEGLEDFYAGHFGLTKEAASFDQDVTEAIAAMKDDDDALQAFAKEVLAAAKAAGIEPAAATAGEGAAEVTISGLPLGYYVVEDTGAAVPISALALTTTSKNVEVTIKADKPTVDKNIDGTQDTDDSTDGDVKYNNAAVGDTVPYKVTSKVPDMTGYTKYYFVVNDTLSKGLTFNNDVAITLGGTELVKDTDYTVTVTENEDGTTSVEIVFKNFIQYKDQKDAEILITYSATVNEDAVIGTEGNPNKVTLTYSNNPNVTDDGTPGNPDKPTTGSPTGETPESITRTYVTAIELIKVDPEGNRLTGAEFEITGEKLNQVLVRKDVYTEDANGEYWKLKDGSYTTTAPVTADDETDTSQYYESTTTKYTKTTETEIVTTSETVTATGFVGPDGVLRFEGLSAGTYTITELKAPNGYNLLKEPITVTIGFTAPTAPSTECVWTYTGTDVVNGTATNHVTIVNNTGKELPSTGGMGTTIFYVAGGILVAAAAVLLVVRKRMSVEK